MSFQDGLFLCFFVFGMDGCAWLEWSTMTRADEALVDCREAQADPGACEGEATLAEERQRDYEHAVERSACYEVIADDPE